MKILLYILILFLIFQIASAADVCVVAYYGKNSENKPDSKCIGIDEGENGYEVMEKTGWSLLWGPNTTYGHMLCKIKDIGTEVSGNYCEYYGDYWNILLNRDGKWLHLPVGLDGQGKCWNYDINSWEGHYCAKDGDFLGFAFGPSGSKPDMFKVNASKVYVDGKKQTKIHETGGKIRDVSSGSKIEFKIEFENLYNTGTGVQIEDISTTGTIEEIVDDDNIEVSLPDFNLGVSKTQTLSLNFEIPKNIEIKDRFLKIEIKADDTAGIKYKKEFEYVLNIEKEPHNLEITKAELNKASYSCKENAVLSLSVSNLGTYNEDADLIIVNPDLNVSINKKFELKVNDEYNERFNIQIPENIDQFSYPISIKVKYGDKEELQTIVLIANRCELKPVISESEEKIQIQKNESLKKESKETPKATQGSLILATVLVILIIIIIALAAIFFVLRK